MSTTYALDLRVFENLLLPDKMMEFYDWAMRTGGTLDKEIVRLSPYLTLSSMNAMFCTPPDFIMVGRSAETRKKVGDKWADAVRTTQKTPVNKLDRISADAYLYARRNGIFADIVEVKDSKIEATYHRLVVSCRGRPYDDPKFYATYISFLDFQKT